MKKFIGEAYLLNVKRFSSKDDATGVETDKWRYEFLVGDQEDGEGTFVSGATVEGYTADHEMIKGGGSFMEVIKVAVSIREYFDKSIGRKVSLPVYEVIDQ